jgi:hypothetical protein
MRRIKKSFKPILGLPCWGVKNGWGSFITLEFGHPTLCIREPYTSKSPSKKIRGRAAQRLVFPRGQWHLWIYCCEWKVKVGSKVIGDWITEAKYEQAIEVLNGQILTAIKALRGGTGWTFEFDLGATLETRTYDRSSEQWMLFESNNKVLTVRADKKYSYGNSKRNPNRIRWFPINA